MSYGLIDDKLHSDPRFRRAGAEATGIWTWCVSWARDTKSADGIVPDVIFASFLPSRKATQALLAEGILERVAGGMYLSGYRRLYTERDERRAAAGRIAAASRWEANRTGDPCESHTVSHANGKASASLTHVRAPAPSPSPDVGTDVPTARTGKRREAPKRYTEAGHTLSLELWEPLDPKPLCGFVAFRERITEALSAGHTADALRRGAPFVRVWSRNGIELALNRNQRPHDEIDDLEEWNT